MALQAAIEHYHALLTDDLAGETQHQLDDQLQRRTLLAEFLSVFRVIPDIRILEFASDFL